MATTETGLKNLEFLTPDKLPPAASGARKRLLRIYPSGRIYLSSLTMETLGLAGGGHIRIAFEKNAVGQRTECYLYRSRQEPSWKVNPKGNDGLAFSKQLCGVLADHFGGFGQGRSIPLDVLPEASTHNSLRLFKIKRRHG